MTVSLAGTVLVNLEPCGPCGHRDCIASINIAETDCTWCGEPVGYGRYVWGHNLVDLYHPSCWVDAIQGTPQTEAVA